MTPTPHAHALALANDDVTSKSLAPEVITADTAYGSNVNHQYAASVCLVGGRL
ncbi:MAG: hypothetical protein LBT86_08910 [Deltaproteobacteria bacterium]|nr:hypothetical protein [Deltaproteobacteria bacterium]